MSEPSFPPYNVGDLGKEVKRHAPAAARNVEPIGDVLADWLPKSGLQLDSRPMFEHYPVDGAYDAKTGAFTCDICVPVAPL